ncbi:mucin-2 protein [Nocardioides sp.]|uniref:mucin-2 protein n=1 Tax=Nocardioides sp. TaxID=35761 RepID=UPI002D7E2142|nr:mucin-2 protein [Nocardioides sp.]HET8959878.1 mucin-2 protein [Nocardioides sp.]
MADHRHKRDTNARRMPKAHLVAGPIALFATAATVGLGVVASNAETGDLLVSSSGASIGNAGGAERQAVVSRSDSREAFVNLQKAYNANLSKVATLRAVRQADTRLWATADLNVWDAPGKDARKIGLLQDEEKILVTGRHGAGRDEVVWKGRSAWVTTGYLSEEKPVEEVAADGSGGDVNATCTNGSSVPSGVSANIVAVHEAVCANFPEITSYGTFRGDGEHAEGLAVDIMTSGDRGWQVAEFVRAHYSELGVNYIMYSQRIWSVDRASEGWRYVEDRGSPTANHYDHVHVTTY